MIKKFSVLILAGMIALPAAAMAGGGGMDPADLEKKIDMLSQQLELLKSQMAEMKADKEVAMVADDEGTTMDVGGSRFELSGDFRARVDMVTADTPSYFGALDIANGVADFVGVNNTFQAEANPATTTVGITGPEAGAFQAATIGALMAGTADPNALNAMGKLMTVSALNPMFAVLPSLLAQDPSQTMGQIGGAFAGMFQAAGPTATDAENINAIDLQSVAGFMKSLSRADRLAAFQALGYLGEPKNKVTNDTMLTNRFRMNMRVKVMENIDFKGRMAMYKSWGMQNNPVDPVFGGPFLLSSLSMDGNRTRQPADNALVMDRAMVNWNNIADKPIWFSVGRRPTSGGPPSEIRQGLNQRMATPTAYMDYPFDGLTLGYAYDDLFGATGLPGRIRFCYGRGFEAGPYAEDNKSMNDVDFAGISWDIFKTENRFLTFQTFGAFNMFNVPDGVEFPNPMEFVKYLNGGFIYDPTKEDTNLILDRANLGNIFHTTAVYQAKHQDLNYFLSLGWSRTDPSGYDELGNSLLTSWWDELEDKDGFSVYTGIRYDIDDKGLKLGLEYNYGSEDWIAFTPGHDDLYSSKLAVRGHAAEAYMVWNVPAGDAIARYAKALMRLSYQHHWYDYTGSGFWVGSGTKTNETAQDPLSAQFYTPIENLDQVSLSFDVYF